MDFSRETRRNRPISAPGSRNPGIQPNGFGWIQGVYQRYQHAQPLQQDERTRIHRLSENEPLSRTKGWQGRAVEQLVAWQRDTHRGGRVPGFCQTRFRGQPVYK
ncbi:hypothetical protein [Cyclobacterium xiamenense]|uniref:hypothetical protein n=1 Tax=Cyclobacterium xiamenense TaxID=1297121 RepID=UPI0035CF0B21